MVRMIESLNISESPYINAALLIVVFVLIAMASDYLLNKILRRLAKYTKSGIDDAIIDAVHRPVFFTVLAAGISMAITYAGLSEHLVFYTDGVLYSIVAVLWMLSAVKISNTIIENAVRRVSDVTGLSNDIVPLVQNITRIVIVLSTMMIILSLWHINIALVLASAGIAGAGVALAAKDTIANFFGGISIFIDRPFKIGDYIVLDRGERGEVVAIGIRSTKVKTLDDVMITIPNAVMINSKIVNESSSTSFLRLRIPVSAAYGSDIDLVEKTLRAIALENANIQREPVPQAQLAAFGEYALNFELLCWINSPALRSDVIDDVNRRVYRKFNELGISIPFIRRDVHIFQQP
ncbi:MAG: mechanosensitive ion channel family protein [Nitrospirae bacterium]|nr:mechanosensitive ion channel family protein [Nitrospirota bacterium]